MRKLILGCCLMVQTVMVSAQTQAVRSKAEHELNAYFMTYQAKDMAFTQQPRLQTLHIDDRTRRVTVTVSDPFAQQNFTDKLVGRIYKHVRKALPKPYGKYDLSIVCSGMPLEQYVPGYVMAGADTRALWGKISYDGRPWVENVSRPVAFSHGLYDRHLTLWQSHGRYYDAKKGVWKWQRPNLFGTTEDLFTQTIVVPYLIPMLENAGAVVFTPRERDWQTAEYIIDRDGTLGSRSYGYSEYSEDKPWADTGLRGFAPHGGTYVDGENPFAAGKARQLKATKKDGRAYVKWQPHFDKAGRYAVYVSYQTTAKSVDDAHYTVFHKGQATEFRVNQRMGGGTWVYLGTFDFDQGDNLYNCVMLTNQSHTRGVVTADAVRFGGGMGNIERGGTTSGYPRTLEGARYSAQWAGAPTSVYAAKGGVDDYADDINTRSRMLNWLGGGSVYMPHLVGQKVPMELSLAIHSDAGYAPDGKSLVGSLAICTTDFNDGQTDAGISRQASRLLADALLTGVTRDMTAQYKQWARRYLWDRNYSETRLPEVPSAILETLSHQNFPDMIYGQDPNFKFDFARSIYKTLARYSNDMHGRPTVIQPLAPQNVSVELTPGRQAHIRWTPQPDPQEPTAIPTGYILYTATGSGGYDNGRKVSGPSATIDLEPGVQYNFRVTAYNRGGESFASETVSAYVQPGATHTILVVNGFHRLSGPAVIDDGTRQGFDLTADPGVSMGLTAGWNGPQRNFDRSRMGIEGENGMGWGGDEWAGRFIMGNTFDYIRTHTEALAACKTYNVVSCSSKALENGMVSPGQYDALDLILGLERYTPRTTRYYQAFTPSLKRILSAYARSGGRMMVSGAYLGSDTTQPDDAAWLRQTLKTGYATSIATDSIGGVNGLGLNFDFYRALNADHYAAHHTDVLQPAQGGICAMRYSNGMAAATAYSNTDGHTFVMGFPFECITDKAIRQGLMKGIMHYLLNP